MCASGAGRQWALARAEALRRGPAGRAVSRNESVPVDDAPVREPTEPVSTGA